jgi:hypothetical protein
MNSTWVIVISSITAVWSYIGHDMQWCLQCYSFMMYLMVNSCVFLPMRALIEMAKREHAIHLSHWNFCFLDHRDHRPCCMRHGVPSFCLKYCKGESADQLTALACATHLEQIRGCFFQGYSKSLITHLLWNMFDNISFLAFVGCSV